MIQYGQHTSMKYGHEEIILNVNEAAWETGYSHLKQYAEKHGHCRVPQGHNTDDDFALGAWVNNQRKAKDYISPERRERLEALPGWVWAPYSVLWEEGYSHLKQYAEEHGHCRVPQGHKTDDDYRLGNWVSNKKNTRDSMPKERIARLEALPRWVWDTRETAWEVGYSYMKQYAEEHGDCLVPVKHNTEDEYALGRWVNKQRTNKISLSKEQIARLEALNGWVWRVTKRGR